MTGRISAVLIGARGIGGGVVLASQVAMAVRIGPDVLGGYAICMAIARLVAAIGVAGSERILENLSARSSPTECGSWARAGLRHLRILNLCSGALALLACCGLVYGDRSLLLVGATGAYGSGLASVRVAQTMLRCAGARLAGQLYNVGGVPLVTASTVAIALFSGSSGVTEILATAAVGIGFCSLAATMHVWRMYPKRDLGLQRGSSYGRDSIRLLIVEVTQLAQNRLEALVGPMFLDLSMIGKISLAMRLGETVTLALTAINTLYAPRISAALGRTSTGAAGALRLMRSVRNEALQYSVPLSLVVLLLGGGLHWWAESVHLSSLFLSVSGRLVNAATGPVGIALVALGRSSYVLSAQVAASAFAILGGVAMLQIGDWGLAAATALAMSGLNIGFLVEVNRSLSAAG